ncbi:YciI family protein [Kitasatospora sp. NPDC052896]|uniref:YciI family protein n=1 Tax=Kitasatospora sp. NPDC052896 TaxID=3364061 RepID=UPI0037C95D46
MFVVTLTYTVPLDKIDLLLPEHIGWLDEQYAAGVILASGRQVPRVGGVLLAQAADRATLEAILATDPFAEAGAASYQVTEFLPTRTVPELAHLGVGPA